MSEKLPPLDVRARWSVAMIAKLLGERRGAAYRALRAHGVPIEQAHARGKRWVYLSDLQRQWPEGWLSMYRAQELRTRHVVNPLNSGT